MMHVLPINDEREHEETTTCWCDPLVQWNDPETGEAYSEALVIHNSADGRELIEQAEEIKEVAGEAGESASSELPGRAKGCSLRAVVGRRRETLLGKLLCRFGQHRWHREMVSVIDPEPFGGNRRDVTIYTYCERCDCMNWAEDE